MPVSGENSLVEDRSFSEWTHFCDWHAIMQIHFWQMRHGRVFSTLDTAVGDK